MNNEGGGGGGGVGGESLGQQKYFALLWLFFMSQEPLEHFLQYPKESVPDKTGVSSSQVL